MPGSQFPHIELIKVESGRAKLEGGGGATAAVEANANNRVGHSAFISTKVQDFSAKAKEIAQQREEAGLPTISSGVPFLLQLPDEDDKALEFISKALDLELVAEYEEGFVIVATKDLDLQKVLDLANDFRSKAHGSGGMAKILDFEENPSSEARIKRILGSDLFKRWPFPAEDVFTLDISIEVAAFNPPGKPRGLANTKDPAKKAAKLATYEREKAEFGSKWFDERLSRECEVESLVSHYSGKIVQITEESKVDFPDSFSMRIEMNGKGFIDLISNFPSLFEACLPDEFASSPSTDSEAATSDEGFELLPAAADAPRICVIDSGIQENHRWLQGAVDKTLSHCFIPGKPSNEVADYVPGGGHGTRVAGACLYPHEVPKEGEYQASFYLVNARVLDEENNLIPQIFPADLVKQIVGRYLPTAGVRIYQHSIASKRYCPTHRMSIWACAIDLLSYQYDLLFVQAAGNLYDRGSLTSPGIQDHLSAGRAHPDYLFEQSSRIANPAQSLQALTVGSISRELFSDGFKQSLSAPYSASSFTRTGFGLWDSIKPEVVEFGGDQVVDTGTPISLTTPSEVCPELIRSTLGGGPAYSCDHVGTSYAAPKVAHIAGHLAGLFPDQSALMYRALIVNSARWPQWADNAAVNERPRIVRAMGYGVPSLERATENSETRVTLITEENYEAHGREGFIFGVPIPEQMRRPGKDFDIRIDVTLSYSAEPRRTRKSRRGYLGVWLDWKTSKRGEAFSTFRSRALHDPDVEDDNDEGNFQWLLGNKKERDGVTNGVTRKNGTIQKDWTYACSYELPDMFGIIVRGHKGWNQDDNATAKFTLAVSFESLDPEEHIYQEIRTAVESEVESRQGFAVETPI